MFNYKDQDTLFKKVNTLHVISFLIQCAIIILFYYFSLKKESFSITDIQTIVYIQYMFIFLTLAVIPGSEYLLKQKRIALENTADPDKKIEQYLIAIILKLSFVELTSISSAAIYFFTGDNTFMYIAVILSLYFLLSKPGKNKILSELNL